MSNSLGIAAATATLRHVLQLGLNREPPDKVGSAQVLTVRPDQLATHSVPSINLFLYNVLPNLGLNQNDLPARRDDGSLSRRPVAALDLYYLISCHGPAQDMSLTAQRLLGRVITTLEVHSVLTRAIIRAAMRTYASLSELTFLKEADLDQQVEQVKISPVAMSAEELSKLWSIFFQAPYEISVAYTATVVLIEADVNLRAALPVRTRVIDVSTAARPQLTAVSTVSGGMDALSGSTVVLEGTAMLGEHTVVLVGSVGLVPNVATATRLEVVLDQRIPAGLHSVMVRHYATRAEPCEHGVAVPTTDTVRAESNAMPLRLLPSVVASADDQEMSFTVSPPVHPGQRASIQLTRLPGAAANQPDARTFWPPPVPIGGAAQSTIVLSRKGVPNGQWLVRVRVDGVDSRPELVGDVYARPELTLQP